MSVFMISDTHFNNENIIKYCNRPFVGVDEANAEMILRWNEKVKPEDIVYHLGDFIMGARNGSNYFEFFEWTYYFGTW